MFKKYHIVIFRDRECAHRHLRFRSGWLVLFFLLFVGAVGCNMWLWSAFAKSRTLEYQLLQVQRTVDEQNAQLVTMAEKVGTLRKDLGRVQHFDAQLRLIMNLESDPVQPGSLGGSRQEDFARSYLPLHRQELLVRKMHSFLNELSTDIRLEEVRQQELLEAVRVNKDLLSAMPSIWPTEGYVTSSFGSRRSPFTGKTEFHRGVDIANRRGTPIYAPANGTVTFVGGQNAYGNTIVIQHGNGISTRYAHLDRYAVKQGQLVKRGELIAYMGNSGRTTGSHLHYEVRTNGVNVNPMRFILN